MLKGSRALARTAGYQRTLGWRPSSFVLGTSARTLEAVSYSSAKARKSSSNNPYDVNEQFKSEIRPVNLRPYQEECIQAVLEAFKEGRRQVGVSLATGSGKTVIFTELIERVSDSRKDARQTLILAHRRELVEQAARHCTSRYPNKSVEIEMGNIKASGAADIIIASVQSINSKDRIDKYDPRKFKLVLVDEAHHIVASSYLRILDHFGLCSEEDTFDKPALVGVSATFSRHDGLALGKVIKHIVYHKDYIDMIDDRWLSRLVFTTVKSGADLSKVRKVNAGDFQTSSLSLAVNRPEVNDITVRSWLARAKHRKSTLVFCVDVQHIIDLAATFARHGIEARYVTGNTPDIERAQTIQAFKDLEFPILLNCGVFTEGTDIPNIDCVLLCRPTRSRNLLVQMIGRGVRLHEDKENCHVIDMIASLDEGIVTTPTLFGLDPDEIVKSEDATELHKRNNAKVTERRDTEQVHSVDEQHPHSAANTKIQFTDYDSVVDLIADTSGDRYIRAISRHAWVAISDTKFVLSNGPKESYVVIDTKPVRGMKVQPSNTGQMPRFFVKSVASSKTVSSGHIAGRYLRPRQIATAPTLESAVRAADTFAAQYYLRPFIVARGPLSRWRDGDASQAQVDFLNKFCDNPDDERLRPDSLSKGQANDMLTKLRHGAKTSWKGIMQAKRKHEKQRLKRRKMEEWQNRENVRVGPLLDQSQDSPVSLESVL